MDLDAILPALTRRIDALEAKVTKDGSVKVVAEVNLGDAQDQIRKLLSEMRQDMVECERDLYERIEKLADAQAALDKRIVALEDAAKTPAQAETPPSPSSPAPAAETPPAPVPAAQQQGDPVPSATQSAQPDPKAQQQSG